MAAHFEIHVGDVERAKTFYAGLFGWDFETAAFEGAEDVGYTLIHAPRRCRRRTIPAWGARPMSRTARETWWE